LHEDSFSVLLALVARGQSHNTAVVTALRQDDTAGEGLGAGALLEQGDELAAGGVSELKVRAIVHGLPQNTLSLHLVCAELCRHSLDVLAEVVQVDSVGAGSIEAAVLKDLFQSLGGSGERGGERKAASGGGGAGGIHRGLCTAMLSACLCLCGCV
jgi:hypothetical protein